MIRPLEFGFVAYSLIWLIGISIIGWNSITPEDIEEITYYAFVFGTSVAIGSLFTAHILREIINMLMNKAGKLTIFWGKTSYKKPSFYVFYLYIFSIGLVLLFTCILTRIMFRLADDTYYVYNNLDIVIPTFFVIVGFSSAFAHMIKIFLRTKKEINKRLDQFPFILTTLAEDKDFDVNKNKFYDSLPIEFDITFYKSLIQAFSEQDYNLYPYKGFMPHFTEKLKTNSIKETSARK